MTMQHWTREPAQLKPWGSGIGPPPGWYGPIMPAEKLPPVLSRTYEGTADGIRQMRLADAEALERRGYFPKSESWIAQRRGWHSWLVAVVLIIVVVGIVMILYYLANPTGALTVTYERLQPATTATSKGEGPTTGVRASAATGSLRHPSAPSGPGRETPAGSATPASVRESLATLELLKDDGAVNPTEYAAKRREILARL